MAELNSTGGRKIKGILSELSQLVKSERSGVRRRGDADGDGGGGAGRRRGACGEERPS